MLTAMMFEYFASTGAELAVLEVGMGGRLDATNIVEPCISVITDIDFDHQKFLGNTLPEIAREKAGIMRPKGVVVLLPQHPLVNDTLGEEIMERHARAISAVKHMPPVSPGAEDFIGHLRNRYPLTVMGEEITVDSPLAGRHQLRNVALAITAAEELNHCGFRITARQIEQGIRCTRWPARFQVLPRKEGTPEIVIDVAHNPAGAWALRSTLSTFYADRPITFIFGAMRDKAIGEIAGILFPLAGRVIAAHADNPRAASAQEIRESAAHTQVEIVSAGSVRSALECAVKLSGRDSVIVITGSIYLVGEALRILSQRPVRQSV
jgi:dihydrofolate synthase/folylpolyglutamate synthase